VEEGKLRESVRPIPVPLENGTDEERQSKSQWENDLQI
jgi:hypothetical protein